jgi:cell wall-associated NlpC family hydrolase
MPKNSHYSIAKNSVKKKKGFSKKLMKNNVSSVNTPSSHPHAQSENPSRNGLIGRRALLKVAAGLGVVGVGAGTLVGGATWLKKAFAAAPPYDGNGAAVWADTYAISSSSDYSNHTQGGDFESISVFPPRLGGDDCTNFVSNCMYNGNLPMDSDWFSYKDSSGNWQYGKSGYHPWTVAPDLYDYLTKKTGYGQLINTFQGPQKGKTPRNGLAPGDVLFYDWGTGEGISHAAIMTFPGLDSNTRYYDQADEHTSDRLRVFWTLEDYWDGLDPTKVKVYCVHIVSNTATILKD